MKPIIAIPGTIALCYRAWSRKSLTTAGIAAAAITAIVHAIHPWSAPFFLLVVFYLGATTATKVGHPPLSLEKTCANSARDNNIRSNTMSRPS